MKIGSSLFNLLFSLAKRPCVDIVLIDLPDLLPSVELSSFHPNTHPKILVVFLGYFN